jgi:penicillin amidase
MHRRLPALALLLASCLGREAPLAPEFGGLSAEVTVIRDRNGIPHIYGATDADVSFAAGYEHARDRLFQMDLLRRTALGRLAEILGERHKDVNYADQDHLLRAVGFYRAAEEATAWLRQSDHTTYRMVSAYAAGVSAFIGDALAGRNGLALPYGFRATELGYAPEPWRPVDTVALGKLQAWAVSSSASYELLSTLIQYALDPDVLGDLVSYRPPEPVFILDGLPPPGGAFGQAKRALREPLLGGDRDRALDRAFAAARALAPFGPNPGSNNWVVSGAVTATGKPILCNDPHLPLSSPPNFHLLHLNTADQGGDLDVAGASFPGAPVVVIGFNRRAAWGATVARGDVTDIFAETLSEDRRSTLHGPAREPLVEWRERIRVRRAGRPVAEYDEREVTIQVVPRHGPVLPAEATLPPALAGADLLSMSWTGLQVTNEIGAFVRLNRAAGVQDFREAMEEFAVGAENFVYADADGHIAYSAHARYPLRSRLDPARPPWFALPGNGEYDWTGRFIPADRVPQALDPAKLFLSTANNDPVGNTADGDPLNDLYYLGPLYDPGYRAARVDAELRRLVQRARTNRAERITTAEMKALQLDTYSRLAEHLRPHLLAAWATAQSGTQPALARFASRARLHAAVDRLAAWDLRATAQSGEAALFHLWLGHLGAATLRDEIGGAIFDRAVEANLDVMLRPLFFLTVEGSTPSGHDYFDDVRTIARETRQETLLLAFERALDQGERVFGSDEVTEWRWDRIHVATLTNTYGGALDLAPVAIPGGVGTVNVADPKLSSRDTAGAPPDVLGVGHGVNLRLVVSFDGEGRPSAEFILPGGQSGDPGTAHFADQIEDWAGGRYRPLPFRREEVEAMAESRVVFPAGFPGVRQGS